MPTVKGFQFPLTHKDFYKFVYVLGNSRFWYTQEDYWDEQLWDSDCNNCKFVKRIPFDRKEELPHINGSPVWCTKWNKQTRAYFPGQFTAHHCFVHIRTGKESPHKNTDSYENPKYSEP